MSYVIFHVWLRHPDLADDWPPSPISTSTRPYANRQGLGGKICSSHVETFCRSIGLRGLELQVENDNTEARALYKKFGFQPADRVPMSKRIKPL